MSRHGSKNILCHAKTSFQYTEYLLFQGRAAASMVTGPFFVITPQKCSFRMPIQTAGGTGVHVIPHVRHVLHTGVACRHAQPIRNATVREEEFFWGFARTPREEIVGGE